METQRLNNPTPNDQLVETCDTLKSLLNRLQAQQLEMDELFENYNEIDDDWRNERIKAPTQDMLIIEQQESFQIEFINSRFFWFVDENGIFENENKFEEYLGEFIVDMTGLLGFSRLKAGDKYEVALRYGKGQKWKSNGQIVKKGYQLGEFSI